MKFRLLGAGVSFLLLAIGLPLVMFVSAKVLPKSSTAQKSEPQGGDYKITGPYTYENLSIYLVHGKDKVTGKKFLTLQEALERKVVIVHETKDVNELAIENVSPDEEVYVQAGDIVKGGQQDRLISTDLIVPARSGRIPIAAFCVERGRWQQRGKEASANFESSDERIATNALKVAATSAKSQSEVWAKVSEAQAKLSRNTGATVNSSVSSSSLQLSLENGKVKEMADAYIKKLSEIVAGKSDVIGYAFAINGKVNSADVYASSVLFRKLWPKLLKASAVEAIAELRQGEKFEAARPAEVVGFFEAAEKGQASENVVTDRVKTVTRENEKDMLLETRDQKAGGDWLHRSYLKKQ